MFQTAAIELARLEHSHGGDDWYEMEDVTPTEGHAAAERDPERQWAHGRIFRCKECADEIRVSLPDPSPVEGALTDPGSVI